MCFPEHISVSKKVFSLPGIGETHITVTSQILDNGGNRVGSAADRYLVTSFFWRPENSVEGFFFCFHLHCSDERISESQIAGLIRIRPNERIFTTDLRPNTASYSSVLCMKRFKTIFMNRFYFIACLCIYIYEYVLTLQEVNTLVNAYGVCGYGWAQYLSLLQHCPALLVISTSKKATGKLCLSLCFHGSVFSPFSGRLRSSSAKTLLAALNSNPVSYAG